MRHFRLVVALALLAALAPALPAGANVSDGDLRRAADDLARARTEAGSAGAALAAGRAEEARLRARLEDLAGEVAAAEVRLTAAREAVRAHAAELFVEAGERSGGDLVVDERSAVRLTYAAAVTNRDQGVVNALIAADADRERLGRVLQALAQSQAQLGEDLEALAAAAGESLAAAEDRYSRVWLAWEQQQEEWRRLAALAATTTTATTVPTTTPSNAVSGSTLPSSTTTATTNTSPVPPPVEGGAFPPPVERWRPLVEAHFAADLVDQALSIIRCESYGDPDAVNPVSGAAGLFQHLPRYWPERAAAAGYPGASVYDPEANIAGAAWLVAVSEASGLPAWYFWTCQP
jgi:hypothetical protein